jgi:hypothetical protein
LDFLLQSRAKYNPGRATTGFKPKAGFQPNLVVAIPNPGLGIPFEFDIERGHTFELIITSPKLVIMKSLKSLLLSAFVIAGMCSFVAAPNPEAGAELPGGAFLTIAGKFGGEISKKEVLKTKELGVDGCAVGSKIFTYTIDINKGGTISTFKEESNTFSKEIIMKMKELNTGDSFEFKKVKAYLPNGKDQVDVHSKKFVVVADNV